jgi:hypothetical protein
MWSLMGSAQRTLTTRSGNAAFLPPPPEILDSIKALTIFAATACSSWPHLSEFAR